MTTLVDRAVEVITKPGTYLSTKQWADKVGVSRAIMSTTIYNIRKNKRLPKLNSELIDRETYFWVGEKVAAKAIFTGWTRSAK